MEKIIEFINNCYLFSVSLLNDIMLFLFSYSLVIQIITILIYIICILLLIALTTLLERKIMASVQRRKGPNVHGFFGLIQPIADGVKLLLKELILPKNTHKIHFYIAPPISLFCCFLLWLVIPTNAMNAFIEFKFSMLVLLGISGVSAYGLYLAGWSSNVKYGFLGGVRSTAQMISYEINLTLLFVTIMILSGFSSSINDVVEMQKEIGWYVFVLPYSYCIFFLTTLAETNRAPFDVAEAESELVAGYNVEYGAMGFAMLFLA